MNINEKIQSIEVEMRMDGAHLRWTWNKWGPEQGVYHQQRHEIILKDLNGPELSRAHMRRVHAFVATITEGDGKKPKNDQKKWEKIIDSGGDLPSSKNFDPAVKKVVKLIANTFKKRHKDELDFARDGLRHSVIDALDHFTPDEVDSIIREAIAESVMKA